MQPFQFRRLEVHYVNGVGDGSRSGVEHVFVNHNQRLHSMKTADDVNKFIDGLGQDGWQIVSASFDFRQSVEYIVLQKPLVYPS
jgi:hypothetical protein